MDETGLSDSVYASQLMAEAETYNAPSDSIQKVDGKWQRIGDVCNEANRRRVIEIAEKSSRILEESV